MDVLVIPYISVYLKRVCNLLMTYIQDMLEARVHAHVSMIVIFSV